MNKKIGVLGYGEVGKAIAQFYKNPSIKDLNRNDGLKGVEVLNICIPANNRFIDVAKKEIMETKPKLVIIHSSVVPGTTKKLSLMFPNIMIAHSPVRGVHPFLHKGIKTFVKYVGADNKRALEAARKHLESLGIKAKAFSPSIVTEAIKLWDTTQYGWMIVLNKEMKKWCDKNKIDFEIIYAEANRSYNEGYRKLGRPEVARPYLKHMPGKIGGHCVIPNCYLLDSDIAKLILKKNKTY